MPTTLLLGLSLLAPGIACAQTSDDWQYRASVYAFFPEIDGRLRAATAVGNQLTVDAGTLVDNLHFAAMGSFEARKGRWGLFTDVIYMDVGDSISNSPTLGRGTVPLPPGVTADASLDIEAVAFTAAATYRVFDSESDTFDLLGGARLLDAKADLQWQFDSPMGPLPPPMGQGRGEASEDGWDAIIGFKGQHRFGARHQWFVPYYLDAGTGASDLTWQAATGIGYSARWGDTFLIWRHLDYDLGQDRRFEDLEFSGPAIGVAFNW